MKIISTLFSALVLSFTYAFAGDNTPLAADRAFIENKGQIGDQNGRPNKDVRFLIVRPGLNIQLKANSFSYDSYVVDRCEVSPSRKDPLVPPEHDDRSDEELTYLFHRVDIELVGANPAPEIVKSEQSADYLNFYTHVTEQANGEQGATFVRGYGRVLYRDVWPSIDLEWLIDEVGNPEYQFMVRPGGDINNIRLRYHGADATELLAESIQIHVKHGPIRERIPKSFYARSGQKVNVRYRAMGNNTFGVEVPPADMAMAVTDTLVIDPTPERLWGAYYGGSGDDGLLASCVSSDTVFGAGFSNSNAGMATIGVFQSNYGGGTRDATALALTNTGLRLWATYIGGNGRETGNGVCKLPSGSIVLTGSTTSNAGISTSGSYQPVKSDTFDIFVIRLTAAGLRNWGTYYGGAGVDAPVGGVVPTNGDSFVVLASTTSGGLASKGSSDSTLDSEDPLLVCWNSSGQRKWSTYLSPYTKSLTWAIYGLHVSYTSSGYVLVAASKTSKETNQFGEALDYVASWATIDTTGAILVYNSYRGSPFSDVVATASMTNGQLLIAYKTFDASLATPRSLTRYNTASLNRAVLRCFDEDGNNKWNTYLPGTENYVLGLRLAVSGDDNIIVAVGTESDSLIATVGSFQSNRNGIRDVGLYSIDGMGERKLWGTYFGGQDDEYIGDVDLASNGVLILSGYTKSNAGVATADVFQPVYSGLQDGFVASFWGCVTPPARIDVKGTHCLGNLVTATVSTTIGATIRWSAPKLGVITTGTLRDTTITIRWTSPGVDTLRVRVMNSSDTTCYRDTAIIITVNASPAPVIAGRSAVCPQDSRVYRLAAFPGRTYSWRVPMLGTPQGSTSSDSIMVLWSKVGTDTLRVRETITATGCSKDTFLVVAVNPQPTPQINGRTVVCEMSRCVYRVPSQSGRQFSWSVPRYGSVQGSTNNDSLVIIWDKTDGAAVDTIRVRETAISTGCSADVSISVQIGALPRPSIIGQTTLCSGSEGAFAVEPGYPVLWTLPKEATAVSGTVVSSSIRLKWQKPGSYLVALRTTNPSSGCTRDTSIRVIVVKTPITDIVGATSLCITESKGKTYSVPQGDPGTQYTWTITPVTYGSVVKGQSTNEVDVDWHRRGTVTLRVRVVGPNGCERDSALTIAIQDSLKPTITSATGYSMCQGDSLVLDAGSGYTTYAWYEGGQQVGTSRYFVTRRASTYQVRVNNGSCAGSSESVTTFVNPLPTATISQDQPGILTGKTDAQQATYQWYDASVAPWRTLAGETQRTYSPSSSGDYGVEVTNSTTGCVNRSAPFTITLGPPPTDPVTTALTPNVQVCAGSQIRLRVRVTGGRQPYQYQWQQDGTPLPSGDTVMTCVLGSSATITCIVADADGKRDTASMTVVVHPYPVAKIIESPRGTLLAEPSGADRYQWITSAGTTLVGANGAAYVPSVSGSYYVEVVQSGCADTSDAYIYEAPPITRLEVEDHDFGTVPIDDLINTSGGYAGSVRVRNLTGQSLELTGANTADPTAFVVPQQWPRRMNDGDSAELAVRFLPTQRQPYNSAITVQTSSSYTGSGTVTGAGRDLLPDERVTQIVLSPARREVDPGDTISVLLLATVERPQITAGKAGKFTATIQWDSRVLEPISSPGLLYDTSGTYGIATVLNGYRQQNQRELYRFRFRAKQGEIDTTSIIFSGANGFVWQDDRKAYPALLDSVVRVRVCQDGGPQIIGRVVPPRIVSIAPNPTREFIDVNYYAEETAVVKVTSTTGIEVMSMTVQSSTEGSLRIDGRGISSGLYCLTISSISGAHSHLILVLR